MIRSDFTLWKRANGTESSWMVWAKFGSYGAALSAQELYREHFPTVEWTVLPTFPGDVDTLLPSEPRRYGGQRGDFIEWTHTYGQVVRGVVVDTMIFLHAMMASSITVFSPDTGWVYRLSLAGYRILHRPADPDLVVDLANVAYRTRLCEHERWREFFEQTPDWRGWK